MSFVAPSTARPCTDGAAIRSRQPQIDCGGCGKSIDHRSLNGKCPECNMRPCSQCGSLIRPRNTTGLCHRCNIARSNADPEFNRRKGEGLRRRMREDPEYAERLRKSGRRMGLKASLDPELRERRVIFGKWLYRNVLSRPDVVAKRDEALKHIGPAMRRAKLPWLPDEYRDEYRKLIRNRKLKAAEARAVIEERIANDEALKDVDSALDYLRRFAPVQKLENGYRYGNAVLTPAEIINRAKVRGWQPERLAA